MKIGISTFGADGGRSGISVYVRETLQALAQLQQQGEAADITFEIIAHDDEVDYFTPATDWSVLRYPAALRAAVPNLLWHQTGLPNLCRTRGYDVLFLPAGNRRLPFHCPCPTVGTVHDFSLLHVSQKYSSSHDFYVRRVLPTLMRQLTRVITVSESSRRDIVGFARVPKERVTVIPEAANRDRFAPTPRDVARARIAERYRMEVPFLLYVSRIEHPGKNHIRLIDAFAQLKTAMPEMRHRLVLAGADWEGAEAVHAAALESGHAQDIQFTGFVPDADIPLLYVAADLVVFPSLYEGFGLPVLEAMQCGAAVACSDVSSLPEVGGSAVAYFRPKQSQHIAHTLRVLLESPSRREELRIAALARSAEFSWDRSARQTLSVLREAASVARASVPRPAPAITQ